MNVRLPPSCWRCQRRRQQPDGGYITDLTPIDDLGSHAEIPKPGRCFTCGERIRDPQREPRFYSN